jgi:type I restriction enzyme S subunit
MKAAELRQSILQAAVQGRLVPQNPSDEPASELLKRIQQEKARLIRDGKIKKEKPLPHFVEDEIPYDLPDGWVWCRLGDLFNVVMGQSPAGSSVSENNGIEFHQGKIHFSEMFLAESQSKTNEPTKLINTGDILLAVRAPVGIVNITQREICIGRGLCAIQIIKDMDSEFVFYFMKSMDEYFNKQAAGTTFIAISADIVKRATFPLPPLAEQQRIVVKVEELMALCSELKTVRTHPIMMTSTAKTIPFPQKVTYREDDLEIGIAARGDATQPFSEKLQNAIDDWDDEDE